MAPTSWRSAPSTPDPGTRCSSPRSRIGAEGAARALYAFGRHDAIGFSRMGRDREVNDSRHRSDRQLRLDRAIGAADSGTSRQRHHVRRPAGPDDPPQKFQVGNYTLEVAFAGPRSVGLGRHHRRPPPRAAAIFIATGPDEYFVTGFGVSVTFSPNTPGPPLAGLATVEEGTFVDGHWVPGRRLAGDDTIEGDCLQLRWPMGSMVPIWQQRTSRKLSSASRSTATAEIACPLLPGRRRNGRKAVLHEARSQPRMKRWPGIRDRRITMNTQRKLTQ